MDFSEIKNIIFDLGNVIINIDFDLTFKSFEKLTSKNLEEVYEEFENQQIWERYELGELTNEAFIQLLRDVFEISASDGKIISAWNALLLDIPKKRIQRIKELSKKYRLFILSNTSDLHVLDVNRILNESNGIGDLKELVEVAYYSYEMELRKPGVEIYNAVLDQSNLMASETVFLDDNYDNIVGANKVGLHTIHVTDLDMCDYLEKA
jgi:glucose-1-phosphatase